MRYWVSYSGNMGNKKTFGGKFVESDSAQISVDQLSLEDVENVEISAVIPSTLIDPQKHEQPGLPAPSGYVIQYEQIDGWKSLEIDDHGETLICYTPESAQARANMHPGAKVLAIVDPRLVRCAVPAARPASRVAEHLAAELMTLIDTYAAAAGSYDQDPTDRNSTIVHTARENVSTVVSRMCSVARAAENLIDGQADGSSVLCLKHLGVILGQAVRAWRES